MRITDFIKVISEKSWVTQSWASVVYRSIVDYIKESLWSETKFSLPLIGKFKVNEFERETFNPKTLKSMGKRKIKTVKIKVSKMLSDIVKSK